MGTLLSVIPMVSIGQGEEISLSHSFQHGLAAAAKRSRDAENNEYREGTHGRADKMLRDISSVDITAEAESDASDLQELEGNSSDFETQVQRSQFSVSGFTYTRHSTNDTNNPVKKTLDVNKNPTVESVTESAHMLSEQTPNQKPFQPESWPKLNMIHEHLNKHQTPPSTVIFARFLASRHSKNYVEIRYSTTENTNETIFESSDKLETLIAPKEDFMLGDTKEEEVKYFLLIFKTCINNLQGQVWWNGFSFILDPTLKNRLKISALETQPISQLLFELTGMKELEVHKTIHRMELRGQIEGGTTENTFKYIRFRGVSTKDIKVKQLRGNLITVHIPAFSQEFIAY